MKKDRANERKSRTSRANDSPESPGKKSPGEEEPSTRNLKGLEDPEGPENGGIQKDSYNSASEKLRKGAYNGAQQRKKLKLKATERKINQPPHATTTVEKGGGMLEERG